MKGRRFLLLLLILFNLLCFDKVMALSAIQHSSLVKILSKEISFKKQIENSGNNSVIFYIKDDFDLNSDSISLPLNSVLIFDGGRLKNGTLIGNHSSIVAPLYAIFGRNLLVKGEWAVDSAYPEWFGALSGSKKDSRPSIQRCLNAFTKTVLSGESYFIGSFSDDKKRVCIDVPKYHTLEGHSSNAQHLQKTIVLSSDIKPNLFCRVHTFSRIANIDFVGNNKIFDFKSVGIGTDINEDVGHVSFSNIKVRFFSIGYALQTYITSLDNCFAVNCYKGFWIHGFSGENRNTGLNMNQCAAYNTKSIAFHLENLTYSVIINCYGDRNGIDIKSDDKQESSPFFFCRNLSQVSFVSCGAEQLSSLFDASNCQLTIDGLRAIIDPKKVGKWIAYFQLGHYSLRNIGVVSCTPIDSYKRTRPIFAFSNCSATVEDVTIFGEELYSGNCSVSSTAIIDPDRSAYRQRGTTSDRPQIKSSVLYLGFMYFDTTINKPIWWDGKQWVDSNGNTI